VVGQEGGQLGRLESLEGLELGEVLIEPVPKVLVSAAYRALGREVERRSLTCGPRRRPPGVVRVSCADRRAGG
jgi:hypothetical protein